MERKSCFLIGHRDVGEEICPLLAEEIERHIERYGVTDFYVGHYGNFDRWAAKAVIAAKQVHPEITLSLLIPYHPTERPIELPTGFDRTYYPLGMERVPRRLAIVRANQYMIRHVDFLIAFAWQSGSNAGRLVEYAEKKGTLKVTNLAGRQHGRNPE